MRQVRARVPRHIRRLMAHPPIDSYQREQYTSPDDRNRRYIILRERGVRGLVRYSDQSDLGIVYVVGWLMVDGGGMAGANRETTGGRVPLPPDTKCEKSGNETFLVDNEKVHSV